MIQSSERSLLERNKHFELLDHGWNYSDSINCYSHEALLFPPFVELKQAFDIHGSMISLAESNFEHDERTH